MSSIKFIALLCAALCSGSAQAAGVVKVVRATIDETKLQGYTATPPEGWTQYIQYSVVTQPGEPVQKIAALVFESNRGASTLPRPFGITIISLANGAILSKENLPWALQIKAADCTIPNVAFLNCQPVALSAQPDTALPSRIVVYMNTPVYGGARSAAYVFDPAAIPGSGNRWMEIPPATGAGLNAKNFYAFVRTSPTTMQVQQVINR